MTNTSAVSSLRRALIQLSSNAPCRATRRFSIRALACIALVLAAPTAHARRTPSQVSAALPAPVAKQLQKAKVPLSAVSVLVAKVGSRQPIIALNADQPMMTASTMKLITTFAGLSILGPDYRWRTSAYARGTMDEHGVLHGTLYIKGTGDPKLVPEELIDLVQKIHRAGITGIDGSLVLDKSFFDVSTRDLPSFDGATLAPYNVGPDPLLYAFKSLIFTLTPSTDGTVAIDVLPSLASLRVDNTLRTTPGACTGAESALKPAITQAASGTVDVRFSGNYPIRCATRSINLAVLDHTQFFANGFLALWEQTGGTFSGTTYEGTVPSNAHLVAVHRGPVLADIVHDINKFSNNVMARNLFLTIGAVVNQPPATPEKSVNAIRAFLKSDALPVTDLTLTNGSGLSRDEQISARALAALLERANASPVAQAFVASLPIVGVDGTMRNRLKAEPVLGNAHIKTGTLRDVRSIAGYVASADGNSYIVVSFINNARAEAARAAHDALLQWVYEGPR